MAKVVGAQVGTLNINQQDYRSLDVRSGGAQDYRWTSRPMMSIWEKQKVWFGIPFTIHLLVVFFVPLLRGGIHALGHNKRKALWHSMASLRVADCIPVAFCAFMAFFFSCPASLVCWGTGDKAHWWWIPGVLAPREKRFQNQKSTIKL